MSVFIRFFRNELIGYDKYFHSPFDYLYILTYNGINWADKLLGIAEFPEMMKW